jgi:hypothetical protein
MHVIGHPPLSPGADPTPRSRARGAQNAPPFRARLSGYYSSPLDRASRMGCVGWERDGRSALGWALRGLAGAWCDSWVWVKGWGAEAGVGPAEGGVLDTRGVFGVEVGQEVWDGRRRSEA